MNRATQAAMNDDIDTSLPEVVEDTYVNILMALEGAKAIGDIMLIYLLRMSLEQLYSSGVTLEPATKQVKSGAKA
ncbi:hypothetical protein [uncultured Cohaesibacter sp.]|uniref:hypothetical protein n=1 Tax=uncultured Cohaesibacter sp. TaxID=1002546 RepID=UPI0029C94B68|nr:hypothetical protein [uncultured Cohaesibacter sp.]